jgi:hypothetical protein
MRKKYYVDLMPPSKLMEASGRLIHAWQLIENYIETTIWGLAGVDEISGRALTAHMAFPLRCDVLRALYHDAFKNAEADKRLRKFIETVLRPLHATRNRFAHAIWFVDRKGRSYIFEKETRAKPYVRSKEVTEKEIGHECLRVMAAHLILVELFTGQKLPALSPSTLADIRKKSRRSNPLAVRMPAERCLYPTIPNKPRRPPRSSRA